MLIHKPYNSTDRTLQTLLSAQVLLSATASRARAASQMVRSPRAHRRPMDPSERLLRRGRPRARHSAPLVRTVLMLTARRSCRLSRPRAHEF